MKQDSATQSDFDLTFHVLDSLLQTPMHSDQRVPSVNDTSTHINTDSLEDILQVLQDMVPSSAYKPPTTNTQNVTPSLYDDLFLQSTTKNTTSHLESIDNIVLQELDAISGELDYFVNYRKGQKVKKRLFSGNFAEEPTPKRRRVSSCEEDYSADSSVFTDSSFSEFTWISSARRS